MKRRDVPPDDESEPLISPPVYDFSFRLFHYSVISLS
jgi:hypothetical protein